MAVTKILPRNGGLKEAIDYVLNGDKTDGHILTAHFNCDPGREYREMMKTKLETGRLDKRQCYHIIQSFKPGEITPELALEIANTKCNTRKERMHSNMVCCLLLERCGNFIPPGSASYDFFLIGAHT